MEQRRTPTKARSKLSRPGDVCPLRNGGGGPVYRERASAPGRARVVSCLSLLFATTSEEPRHECDSASGSVAGELVHAMKSMNLTRTMRTRATPGLHAVAGRLGPRLTATAFSPASCLLPFPDLPAASMHRRVSRTRYRAVTLTQEAVGGEVAARLGERVRARSAQVVLRRVGDECSFCLPRVVFGKAELGVDPFRGCLRRSLAVRQ